jgi:hypothetical protein
MELDKCEVCKGKNGGLRGNENIIKGVIMCDYCSAARFHEDDNTEIIRNVVLDIG